MLEYVALRDAIIEGIEPEPWAVIPRTVNEGRTLTILPSEISEIGAVWDRITLGVWGGKVVITENSRVNFWKFSMWECSIEDPEIIEKARVELQKRLSHLEK